MFSAQMRSSQYFRKARRYVMMPFHGSFHVLDPDGIRVQISPQS
jgi:hypothetical protein